MQIVYQHLNTHYVGPVVLFLFRRNSDSFQQYKDILSPISQQVPKAQCNGAAREHYVETDVTKRIWSLVLHLSTLSVKFEWKFDMLYA
jgi:hypothetical protein